jgi:hypothetical protein
MNHQPSSGKVFSFLGGVFAAVVTTLVFLLFLSLALNVAGIYAGMFVSPVILIFFGLFMLVRGRRKELFAGWTLASLLVLVYFVVTWR